MLSNKIELFKFMWSLGFTIHDILVVGQFDDNCDLCNKKLVDISSKIETLEDRFDNLRTQIIDELSAKPNMTVQALLDKLTSLPLSLKREYESSIATSIHSMRTETQINELFIIHLNPLTSFIEYGLIEYVIRKFGSDGLKKDMQSYHCDMQTFMKQTTVKQLVDYFPGQPEVPPKFSLIEAKIGEDASKCTLEQLNTIRRRYCSEVRLSEIVFHLVAVVESNSFIVRWLVPSALISRIIMLNFTELIDQSFYQECKITSFILDGMWLFLSEYEIDAMWSQIHVSDTKFKDQFHTMYKQIVCELKMGRISEHELSLYLKSLKYHEDTSDRLSWALLKEEHLPSSVDFSVLTAIIERFGSDCLRRVMKSYCKYISIFTNQSTAQQLINVPTVLSSEQL